VPGKSAAVKPMGGGKKPAERPHKICPVCGRPFAWRKKWERDWDMVVYCSDKCRAQGRP